MSRTAQVPLAAGQKPPAAVEARPPRFDQAKRDTMQGIVDFYFPEEHTGQASETTVRQALVALIEQM